MNKVISREYVEKNYIHKDVLRKILKNIEMSSGVPVRNTRKSQCYYALQIIWYMIYDGYEEFFKYHIKQIYKKLQEDTKDVNKQ